MNANRARASGPDEADDDLRAFGFLPDAPIEQGPFAVWPENWDVVQAFMAVQTQWRYVGTRPVGLDYTAVDAALRLRRTQNRAEIFDGLRVMEYAVLDELANG